MSWDIQINGTFLEEVCPAKRFLEFVHLLNSSSKFSGPFSVLIFDYLNYKRVKVLDFRESQPHSQDFHAILEPYFGISGLSFSGDWSVDIRYETTREDQQIRTEGRVSVILPARDMTDQYLEEQSSFTYVAGNSNIFSSQLVGFAANLNFQELVDEITILSRLGVKKLRGEPIDGSEEIKSCFLSYNYFPYEFALDLYKGINPNEVIYGLIENDIKFAAIQTQNTQFFNTPSGCGVFHQDLISGNLESFYSYLKRYIESMI
jgi:hypothetical protein